MAPLATGMAPNQNLAHTIAAPVASVNDVRLYRIYWGSGGGGVDHVLDDSSFHVSNAFMSAVVKNHMCNEPSSQTGHAQLAPWRPSLLAFPHENPDGF